MATPKPMPNSCFKLVFAQASGALIFGPLMVTALIGVFALLALIIFCTGVKMFKREEILSKPA